MITWGISSPFELLSPSLGQVTNALLTRSPLRHSLFSEDPKEAPFDLHVLGTPPAFILSQDQTLRKKIITFFQVFVYGSFFDRARLLSYHSSIVKVLGFVSGRKIVNLLAFIVKGINPVHFHPIRGQRNRLSVNKFTLKRSQNCRKKSLGNDLLSQGAAPQVPSALTTLTSGFGMCPGVPSSL